MSLNDVFSTGSRVAAKGSRGQLRETAQMPHTGSVSPDRATKRHAKKKHAAKSRKRNRSTK